MQWNKNSKQSQSFSFLDKYNIKNSIQFLLSKWTPVPIYSTLPLKLDKLKKLLQGKSYEFFAFLKGQK